ncbi:hypothetical protein LEP1GSC055_3614 [Leptospira borgpetersenii str. Brem 307]|uniref:Uncharacterized protein n=1 Tax=Leptospira borgpetersenii str. Brem 328 TaxID=1049780 RepID=A0ABC9SCW4_LEPBO|nr:hypothetical protein LEP1GSC055_3614 [Leptospira borgpetersenii str. Brem 307]EMN15638.1 hypothetical protein LEP1GSC056_4137 [Leptospira borgpetersenii str. Brem 328]
MLPLLFLSSAYHFHFFFEFQKTQFLHFETRKKSFPNSSEHFLPERENQNQETKKRSTGKKQE